MYIEYDDPDNFALECQEIPLDTGEWLLICIGQQSEPNLNLILSRLSDLGVRCFGGVFPGVIHDGKVHGKGAIVQKYKLLTAPAVARIEGDEVAWTHPLPEILEPSVKPTCLVLADFSCVSVAALLVKLFDSHANDVNYFGAGAGSGAGMGVREPRPVVFCNEERFTGCALVVFIASRGEVHLRHGWSRVSESVVATRTQANVIKELNWEPAMTVYRGLVGDHVADSLGRKEDVPTAKQYPFGIAREGLEDVVRDPLLSTEAGELVVLSDVPEHSVMHILEAAPERLIAAAGQLGADFAATERQANCLLFDCYSRAMLLGDQFSREISEKAYPLGSGSA